MNRASGKRETVDRVVRPLMPFEFPLALKLARIAPFYYTKLMVGQVRMIMPRLAKRQYDLIK
jgi:hypothetical protein